MSDRTIFVTGASGFVGKSVLAALISAGYRVHALSNRESVGSSDSVQTFKGDMFDPAVLDAGMAGCDGVIHLVGIIMENPAKGATFERIHHQGTIAVVDAARRNGIRRYVQMSALGARPNAASDYHKTKFEAEEYIRGNGRSGGLSGGLANGLTDGLTDGLDWTIIRPSMIHGPKGEFTKMEAMWARKRAPAPLFFQPFMPYFGGKRAGLLQPVFVDDVARAFVESLGNANTIGKIYEIGGPDKITWPQMHEIFAEAIVGHRRWVAAIPVGVAKVLVAAKVAPLLGFNRDQLIMSQEDNTCDMTPFANDFGWMPRPLAPVVKAYAMEL